MVAKYSNYRNPVVHNFTGAVVCVKNEKNFNVSAGMRLNGLSSIKTGADSQVSILLDETAKKGKLCGIVAGSGVKIGITVNSAGVTAEIIEGICTEVNAEQDSAVPSGLGNVSLGVRG